jgi:hypothetical protein
MGAKGQEMVCLIPGDESAKPFRIMVEGRGGADRYIGPSGHRFIGETVKPFSLRPTAKSGGQKQPRWGKTCSKS